MKTRWPGTIIADLPSGRSFGPENKNESHLRTRPFDGSISEWKRLDRLSAARESKVEVLAELFVAKCATSARPRTLAARMLVHLESQLASRFSQFWVE